MKSTGIVCKLDELGRIVIPFKLRRALKIEVKTALEFLVDSDKIVLQKCKHSYTCLFCGSNEEITRFKGKNICKKCLVTITE